MQISIILLQQLVMLNLMILMGYALVKSGLLKTEDSKSLSVTVIYLVLPCVIIRAFQIPRTNETLQGILFAFSMAVLVHGIFSIFIQVGGKLLGLTGVEKATVMYSNAGNMVIPIVGAVLGEHWVLYTSAYVAVQLILMWTHGSMVIGNEKKIEPKKVIKNINVIAIVIGMLLFFAGISIPPIVADTMGSVGALLAPMGMFITGMIIAKIDFKQALQRGRVYVICGLRLLIMPLLIMLILYAVGFVNLVEHGNKLLLITFLATITPSSSTIIQMAQIYGKDAEYAGILNFVSSLVCIITMPILVWIFCILFHI